MIVKVLFFFFLFLTHDNLTHRAVHAYGQGSQLKSSGEKLKSHDPFLEILINYSCIQQWAVRYVTMIQ